MLQTHAIQTTAEPDIRATFNYRHLIPREEPFVKAVSLSPTSDEFISRSEPENRTSIVAIQPDLVREVFSRVWKLNWNPTALVPLNRSRLQRISDDAELLNTPAELQEVGQKGIEEKETVPSQLAFSYAEQLIEDMYDDCELNWNRTALVPMNSFRLERTSNYAELLNTLAELQEVGQEAIEEEETVPSQPAFSHAEQLIREMYDTIACPYLVELFPKGGIAITVPGGHGSSVMVVCESAGGALCSVNINGKYRSARYTDAEELPDAFLREALDQLWEVKLLGL